MNDDHAAAAASTAIQWAARPLPDAAMMEAIADAAFAALPAEFRAQCASIVFYVDEFADRDALEEVGVEDPYDLLGLFTGTGLAHRGAEPFTGELPNMIHLYRQPILAYWAACDETLGTIVSHVLVHEIGHHFGLSDEDMDRLDNEPD